MKWWLIFALAALSLLLAGASTFGRRPSPPPDVLLVVADDVGLVDLVEAYTPNLDALASISTVYGQAYANPTCSPTRHALMLGRWRPNGGDNPCKVDGTSDLITGRGGSSVVRAFAQAGYATGIFGKWHLGSASPWNEAAPQSGFDAARALVPNNVAACDPPLSQGSYSNWLRLDDGAVTEPSSEYHTEATRDAFMSWWQSTKGPRFGVLAWQAAHGPFHRPPAALLHPAYPPTLTAREKYLAMIHSLDTAVGQALGAIDMRNTIVFFVGDNGTPTAVAPEPGRAKTTTYERGIHVPMSIFVPGRAPAVEMKRLVHVVDIYATMFDVLGLPAEGDGFSLLQSRNVHEYVLCGVDNFDDRCARSTQYKLRRKEGVEQFFDLVLDPDENLDLISSQRHQQVIEQHRAWLELIP